MNHKIIKGQIYKCIKSLKEPNVSFTKGSYYVSVADDHLINGTLNNTVNLCNYSKFDEHFRLFEESKTSIDNVTTNNLKATLEIIGIYHISDESLDKIIDIVELLEMKGNQTTLNDIFLLKKNWK